MPVLLAFELRGVRLAKKRAGAAILAVGAIDNLVLRVCHRRISLSDFSTSGGMVLVRGEMDEIVGVEHGDVLCR